MRENVMGELHQVQPEAETKRKMLDILKRFHSEEEDMNCDDDDVDDDEDEDGSMLSEETVQKILSGNEVKFEDLSPEEIKQFRRSVASGDLSKLIEPWEPWWRKPSAGTISLSPEGTQLITLLRQEETTTNPETNLSEIPNGPEKPLPPLSQLSRIEPSPLLPVHLVDVLYAYCFTLRLYNGDWKFDPLGAATVVLTISAVLGDNKRPETVGEALSTCLEQTCSPVYRHAVGFRFGVGLIDDIICLLSLGGDALVCLLCDLQRLVQGGEKMLKSEKMGKSKRAESNRKLRGAERKVYFLMCWVHEQPKDVWTSLAGIVGLEKASLSAVGDGGPNPAKDKGITRAKVLIEEI